jgi:hypothetical protein
VALQLLFDSVGQGRRAFRHATKRSMIPEGGNGKEEEAMKTAKWCMAVLMTSMMLLMLVAVGVAFATPDGTAACCAGGGGGGGAAAPGGGGDGAGSGAGGSAGGTGVGAGGATKSPTAGFLTPAQENTYDVFNACAAHYTDARIDTLAPDGSFTFSAAMTHDSYAIKACMAQHGFKFHW